MYITNPSLSSADSLDPMCSWMLSMRSRRPFLKRDLSPYRLKRDADD